MLCPVLKPIPSTMIMDCELNILEYKSIICPGFTCVLHVHSIVGQYTGDPRDSLISRDISNV